MNSSNPSNNQSRADGELLCQCDRGILTLTINRPKKANALSVSILEELVQQFHSVQTDKTLKAVIITAIGGRVFSGGADLKDMEKAENDAGFASTYFDLWDTVTDSIMQSRLPTFALVNGVCVAGGLSLALACDIRLATENATFSYPRVSQGHLPGRHNLTQLARLIGKPRTKMILLASHQVTAREALEWGLVEMVFDQQEIDSEVEHFLEPLRQSDPDILVKAKSLIDDVE